MYSQYLQEYIAQVSVLAEVDPGSITLLNKSLGCFLSVFSEAINAEIEPGNDLLEVSLSLLMLDSGLASLGDVVGAAGIHYLIGMGFEQSGELLSRLETDISAFSDLPPLANDYWYRLALALLHYLAGGHRVQALSTLRHLERLAREVVSAERGIEYQNLDWAFQQLYRGVETAYSTRLKRLGEPWEQLLFGTEEPADSPARRLHRLVQKIRNRKESALEDLGLGSERNWLLGRDIDGESALNFWKAYLQRLRGRNITTFTNEQKGPEPGFDVWLRPKCDLLVVLPTGSGKTVIGELKTALTLAQGQHTIWILPTRALVRQVKRELRRAFQTLPVQVDELPTTEDFLPLFADSVKQTRYVAVTTPEKLEALIRSNPKAIEKVGLVVLDEAHILTNEKRGTTVEFVLQQLRNRVPDCTFVLMTAFQNAKEILGQFIHELSGHPNEIRQLTSDVRPTRRIYGIITTNSLSSPIVAIYPPGVQDENTITANPYILRPRKIKVSSDAGQIEIAQKFVQAVTRTKIRSALFVSRKSSTETQANRIAKAIKKSTPLPAGDIARLTVELGRQSVIEDTGHYGVAPHHAGLMPLEQHLVEKWILDGHVRTVVATPTLAAGVNLPFDLSVVSFTQRFNPNTGGQEPITETEIQNMLGRAGRAGYVSDGICLLAIRTDGETSPPKALDRARRYFFRTSDAQPGTGLSRLAATALRAKVDKQLWLTQIKGTTLAEAQTLISFVLDASWDRDDIDASLHARISAFPSAKQLTPEFVQEVVTVLSRLVQNIRQTAVDEQSIIDMSLLVALRRTGMPFQLLQYYFQALRATPELHTWESEQQITWADNTVRDSMEAIHNQEWLTLLLDGIDIPSMFDGVRRWRSGASLQQIEENWNLRKKPKDNRRAIGQFFNHGVSQIAQFWGALAICDEIMNGPTQQIATHIQRMQTFVREGVSSILELGWLHSIGQLDRVLAHRLAEIAPFDETVGLRRNIRNQLSQWNKNRDMIPKSLDETEQAALLAILDDPLLTL